jgi:hypothetical protein
MHTYFIDTGMLVELVPAEVVEDPSYRFRANRGS